MASDRQVQANRQNARNSCGPRTIAGKKRSSRNSTRHGLNVINRHHPQYAAPIRGFAEYLCGAYRDYELLEYALIIAETQFILAAVRQQVVAAIERDPPAFSLSKRNERFVHPLLLTSKSCKVYDDIGINPTCTKGQSPRQEAEMTMNKPSATEAEAISNVAPMLLRLDRYARRAWSWRRTAVRQFVRRRNELEGV